MGGSKQNLSGDNIRPFYARTRFVFAVLIAAVIYSYGWKVTEIDIGELARDAHLVKPLVRELLRPDLFTANSKSQTVEAEFYLSDTPSVPSPESRAPEGGAVLVLSAKQGEIGDRVTVRGTGFEPGREGSLFWVNAIEQEFLLGKIESDIEGNFFSEITVPELARGNVQKVRAILTWRTGGWRMSHTLHLTIDKMVETVFLALMATTFGVLVAAPLSFLGARNLMVGTVPGTGIYYLVRTVFNVLRSIEPLIMAILFAVWVGIGPFAGMLALGLHSIAALGKLFSEQIESIDPGPIEAVTATGATPVQVVLYAVVPQVVPQFLALSFYRWDINVRMSTIIGFVGGGGIGFLLQQWINLLKYNEAGTALLAIALVVITLDTISAKVREKLIAP